MKTNICYYANGMFYPGDIEYNKIPSGAVEVSAEDFAKAMNRRPGETFTVSAEGSVTVIPVPAPTQEQHIAQAEAYKKSLLNDATQKIAIWQTKLLMGRKLTDDESAILDAWMDYIDEVTATKTATAPDIEWPPTPSK